MKVRRIWEKWHAGGADEDDFVCYTVTEYRGGAFERISWDAGGIGEATCSCGRDKKGVEREDVSLGMLTEGGVEAEMWVDFIPDRKAIKSIG